MDGARLLNLLLDLNWNKQVHLGSFVTANNVTVECRDNRDPIRNKRLLACDDKTIPERRSPDRILQTRLLGISIIHRRWE